MPVSRTEGEKEGREGLRSSPGTIGPEGTRLTVRGLEFGVVKVIVQLDYRRSSYQGPSTFGTINSRCKGLLRPVSRVTKNKKKKKKKKKKRKKKKKTQKRKKNKDREEEEDEQQQQQEEEQE